MRLAIFSQLYHPAPTTNIFTTTPTFKRHTSSNPPLPTRTGVEGEGSVVAIDLFAGLQEAFPVLDELLSVEDRAESGRVGFAGGMDTPGIEGSGELNRLQLRLRALRYVQTVVT